MAAAPAARAASYCGGPRIWSLAEGYLGEPASQLHEWAFTESYAREWRCLAALPHEDSRRRRRERSVDEGIAGEGCRSFKDR